MSAFDELVSAYHDAIGLSKCEITDEAISELAVLRTALADAQRERDEARAQLREIGELIAPLDGQTLLEAVSYLIHDDSEPLTPRRCVTCARDAAREMRENAESICRDWNRAPYLAGSNFGGDSIPFAMRFHLADAISALPLPAECADCNPLKPESEATT